MNLLLPFIIGFSTSFFGMIFPSMLNMTTVKITLERGKFDAIKFALGVSVVVLIQAYVAIYFTKFLKENPDYIHTIQIIAVIIFSLLSLYFYNEFKKENKKRSEFNQKCRDTFVIGLFLSTLNMFAFPFYYGITIFFKKMGWMQLSNQNMLYFIGGSAIGTFIILFVYSKIAKFIKVKSNKKSNKLSLVLSVITGLLALVTIAKLTIF